MKKSDKLCKGCIERAGKIAALQARVDRLTEALRPFSKEADRYGEDWLDSIGIDGGIATVGDLRRAKWILREFKKAPEL